ncbi:TetR/AcrR family transcriptional regulator [Phytoactinopolyspora halotolerans]|uniref:TetR/AcrR family transcriptional regulator n=1 Tax=Phytoactinopolyspora halotolerans TaxID=1981512 RepID=A0A6L9SBV6_9ACTN|nr:TetR/AcrR family transcriptional regulator [Phytoactinopolyspora halotolerans]NEE02835.1 TetR/AcrR family transcriptional regulator [Phytoactinopolyspora halotolerans]
MHQGRTTYHHGALRDELLRACLRLIETEGIGAVSLRRVAREAGVSPGAPYHHFADRATLLAELSTQGYKQLAERLAAARNRAGEPAPALAALVQAYVEFARSEPGYFHLMFRPELSTSTKSPDVHQAGYVAFNVLADAVGDCVLAGTIAQRDASAVALAVWGLGHGLASLWVDGHLDEGEHKLSESPEAAMARIAGLVETALGRAAPPASS